VGVCLTVAEDDNVVRFICSIQSYNTVHQVFGAVSKMGSIRRDRSGMLQFAPSAVEVVVRRLRKVATLSNSHPAHRAHNNVEECTSEEQRNG
jgi:hypothetical protein